MKRPRRILHADLDAFFAAVELKRHPELRGKPVVVGGRGDPHSRGVVSTATYEAREFGIHSGMPLRLAWRLCPEAVFLPVDFEAYAVESERFKSVLQRFSHTIEDAGIDEAYVDVSGADDPVAVARAIKEQVKAKTGLTCSVGIAPNKLLAKLASGLQKPDGLTVLSEQDIPARVWPLPPGKLLGIGPKTEARLKEMGWPPSANSRRCRWKRSSRTLARHAGIICLTPPRAAMTVRSSPIGSPNRLATKRPSSGIRRTWGRWPKFCAASRARPRTNCLPPAGSRRG